MWAIDFDQDLIASAGTVTLYDRKDAGLYIRVPASMAVDSKLGGKIRRRSSSPHLGHDGRWRLLNWNQNCRLPHGGGLRAFESPGRSLDVLV